MIKNKLMKRLVTLAKLTLGANNEISPSQEIRAD